VAARTAHVFAHAVAGQTVGHLATSVGTGSAWLNMSQVGCLYKPLRQQYFELAACHLAQLLTPSQGTKKRSFGQAELTIIYRALVGWRYMPVGLVMRGRHTPSMRGMRV
jgi:hypothetical protein